MGTLIGLGIKIGEKVAPKLEERCKEIKDGGKSFAKRHMYDGVGTVFVKSAVESYKKDGDLKKALNDGKNTAVDFMKADAKDLRKIVGNGSAVGLVQSIFEE